MPPSKFLASISHAVSGSAASGLSTLATYPLDLVNTRLKVQRVLAAGRRDDDEVQKEYDGIIDAFSTIYSHEGGLPAFFTGLAPDVVKSAADSFLFFLFYNWFRSRRLSVRAPNERYLRAAEELAVGAVAGACARLLTTPVGNVVTRQQTASVGATFGRTLAEIRREKGLLGLWAGYSASLVLTLNPSITFFLQNLLKKTVVPREQWDDMVGELTFLLAAVSKVVATTLTYPFQIAKARFQLWSAPTTPLGTMVEEKTDGEGEEALTRRRHKGHVKPNQHTTDGEGGEPSEVLIVAHSLKSPWSPKSAHATVRRRRVATGNGNAFFRHNIIGMVCQIARTEGPCALYDGIAGELLKAFFNHGLTMLSKDRAHALIVRLYFASTALLRRHPEARAKLAVGMQIATMYARHYYARIAALGPNRSKLRLGSSV